MDADRLAHAAAAAYAAETKPPLTDELVAQVREALRAALDVGTGPLSEADRVELNLTPGIVPAATVLDLVGQSLEIEKATYMENATGGVSEPVAEFQELLQGHRHHGGEPVEWASLERFDFYAAARGEDVSLVIVSGEVRPYACIMLTVGVP